jgi:hypothetical protein
MITWNSLNIKRFLERLHIFEDVEGIMKTTKKKKILMAFQWILASYGIFNK